MNPFKIKLIHVSVVTLLIINHQNLTAGDTGGGLED